MVALYSVRFPSIPPGSKLFTEMKKAAGELGGRYHSSISKTKLMKGIPAGFAFLDPESAKKFEEIVASGVYGKLDEN